jgi:hypothetical protein
VGDGDLVGCWLLVSRFSLGGVGFWFLVAGLVGGWDLGSFLRILIRGLAEALEFQEGF